MGDAISKPVIYLAILLILTGAMFWWSSRVPKLALVDENGEPRCQDWRHAIANNLFVAVLIAGLLDLGRSNGANLPHWLALGAMAFGLLVIVAAIVFSGVFRTGGFKAGKWWLFQLFLLRGLLGALSITGGFALVEWLEWPRIARRTGVFIAMLGGLAMAGEMRRRAPSGARQTFVQPGE